MHRYIPTLPTPKPYVATTDAWGRPIMQPGDGHSAWACNNYDCTDHPANLYGRNR